MTDSNRSALELALVVCALFAATQKTCAQISTNSTSTNNITRLPEVVVQGRADDLVGVAQSASQGTVGAAQLEDRPILRSGEILETVPGVIVTQHAGGGKANQYFVRGFNLDHGTDIAIFLDGMPLNLPTHAHGEGYSDMNVVIPEFVQRVNYEKGPYYADVGNYGSAAAAHLEFFKTLPQNFATVEGGMFGYARSVIGVSTNIGPGSFLFGAEAYHDDGPWTRPDDYQKFNGLLTYSQGNDANGYSITGRAYHGKWNSSDQIAASFGATNFFGTLNPTDGGESSRYSLQAEWHRADEHSATKVMAYGFYYNLDLFSDFTYFLTDPVLGDQFEQQDNRWVGGLDARHTIFTQWFNRDVENTFGLQARNDSIRNGLYQTENRIRINKFDLMTNGPAFEIGTPLPATTEADDLLDSQIGFYAENKIQWGDKFRSVAALRGDIQYFDVTSLNQPANSGTSTDFLPSPKLSLIFGPWADTEVYAQGGFGFHSNDGRGTTQTVEPISADHPFVDTASQPIPGLIQTKGAEIGVRTAHFRNVQSTLSLWYLHSDSELQQSGDTGGTVASKQPSNRYGIEWANYYTPTKHLAFDLDVAKSIARFTEPDEDGGTHVPEAIDTVISAGATLHDWNGFTASLRLRYFGPRDLISTGDFKSQETILLNLLLGYQFNKTWSIQAEVLNLLDRHDHDIDYAYESRVTPSSTSLTQIHFHPVEPIQTRFALTAHF